MPSSDLKPHQEQLLRELVSRGRPIPADEVDGRSLRPLRTLKLVVVRNGLVMPTGAALVHLGVRAGEVLGGDEPDNQQLSASQQDLLWSLGRRSGPTLADHLDGRSLRPLLERALVTDRGGWISITDEGRAMLETIRKARRKPGGARTPGGARAETIWRALDLLEDAVPSEAEIPVGRAVAYGDDVLLALRDLARELKRGERER
ncbi:MAG: hypothetical protein JO040_14600 [Gemmatimonadetes bacterium]|nr:hypothetical protein [Gemmatimonadota bacterium]